MYDPSDPRAAIATAAPRQPGSGPFSDASFAKFHELAPAETAGGPRNWFARGRNFILCLTEGKPGDVLARTGQADEYVAIAPDADTGLEITGPAGDQVAPGRSLVILPPGDSTIRLPAGGRLIRLFTIRAEDLLPFCANGVDFAAPDDRVAPAAPWPEPPDGYRIRVYPLDVPSEPGRFGRIWRCTTFMINYLDPRDGPRDPTKFSPHQHDDFEQGSLCLEGEFVHHLRWPWTTNKHHWRPDQHERCGAPSLAIIPPPSIHTSESVAPGLNQLVDIFCPPRRDFSLKPGWVLNEADYPMVPS